MMNLDMCRCPGTGCGAKESCERAITPDKYEVVTWAALYVLLYVDKSQCKLFIDKNKA